MENKGYTLRSLKASDVFLMTKIITKIGIKEIKNCFSSDDIKNAINGDETGDTTAVGMQVMFELASLVVSHLSDCEREIYQFLSALSGMKAEEIAELPMTTFFDMVMDVFRKEDFSDFFRHVVGLSK